MRKLAIDSSWQTVWEDEALRLQAMDALVPRVQDVLVLAWAAHRPELAINERDQVGHGHARLGERLGKLMEVRRP